MDFAKGSIDMSGEEGGGLLSGFRRLVPAIESNTALYCFALTRQIKKSAIVDRSTGCWLLQVGLYVNRLQTRVIMW